MCLSLQSTYNTFVPNNVTLVTFSQLSYGLWEIDENDELDFLEPQVRATYSAFDGR